MPKNLELKSKIIEQMKNIIKIEKKCPQILIYIINKYYIAYVYHGDGIVNI